MAGAEEEMTWQTYWCHSCDMSVSLVSALTCPHCLGGGDCLELMDSPPFPPPPLPDGPLLRSLLRRLSSDSAPSVTAIPTVTIPFPSSSSSSSPDPCAVCKDNFTPGAAAKQLPCGHLYHPGCILPWLACHDSCPLCRFRLPPGDIPEEITFAAADAEDWSDYATTLTYIARKHNLLFSAPEIETGEEEEEEGLGSGAAAAAGDREASVKVSSSSTSPISRLKDSRGRVMQ